jgi:predicted RNA-binding protein associated with RNAse of E/G family
MTRWAGQDVICVHYQRLSARGLTVYIERRIEDNGARLTTEEWFQAAAIERVSSAFWKQGLLAEGRRLARIRKHYFYHEYFDVLAVFDVDEGFAGYYIDIVTPLRQVKGDYHVTDLFLDFWLAPGRPPMELDQGEFDEAAAAGVMDLALADQARATFARLRREIAAGIFPYRYIRG